MHVWRLAKALHGRAEEAAVVHRSARSVSCKHDVLIKHVVYMSSEAADFPGALQSIAAVNGSEPVR
jgi:hypothetical protein